MKKFWLIAGIIFLIKLVISPWPIHVDILSNAAWGEWIYFHGPKGFYENSVWVYSWPTQLPAINLIFAFNRWLYFGFLVFFLKIGNGLDKIGLASVFSWWFEFVKWFDLKSISSEIWFKYGFIVSMKFLAILADLIISWILFLVARKEKINGFLWWPIVFLVSPFSWYVSAFWGQNDGTAALVLLMSFLMLILKNKYWLPVSLLLFSLSIGLKPTGMMFVPLYIYFLLRSKTKIEWLMLGIILTGVVNYFMVKVFANTEAFDYLYRVILPKALNKGEPGLTVSAFNFWKIITGNTGHYAKEVLFLWSSNYWGYLMVAIVNWWGIFRLKSQGWQRLFEALFVVGVGTWMFGTVMLERYEYMGILAGLFVCIYNKKFIKYWVILSLIFMIDMYSTWFFPLRNQLIIDLFGWQNGLLSRFLSLVNVVIFLAACRYLVLPKTPPHKTRELGN